MLRISFRVGKDRQEVKKKGKDGKRPGQEACGAVGLSSIVLTALGDTGSSRCLPLALEWITETLRG